MSISTPKPLIGDQAMKLDEMAPVTSRPSGTPPWLGWLAENAVMESTASGQLVEGKTKILALLKRLIPLHEYQNLVSRHYFGSRFFMESYRARLRGVSIQCSVIVHLNEAGEADSLLVDYHPLALTLLFERMTSEAAADHDNCLPVTIPAAHQQPVTLVGTEQQDAQRQART
jgi:hypothetical protein